MCGNLANSEIRINFNNKIFRVECVTSELRPNKNSQSKKEIFLAVCCSVRHRVSPISTNSFNPLAPKSGVTSCCIFALPENMHTWVNAKNIQNICKNIAFEFRMKFIRDQSKCIRIIGLLWIMACRCAREMKCGHRLSGDRNHIKLCPRTMSTLATKNMHVSHSHDMLAIRPSY